MPFDFYNEFYGTYVGVKIRGALSKRFIYQVVNNRQRKYAYCVPSDPKSAEQLRLRDLLRKATQSWHTLSDEDKNFYRESVPEGKPMTGFNYYVSLYINNYK